MNRCVAPTLVLVLFCASCDDAPGVDCPEADTADLVCPAEIGPFQLSSCGPTPNGVEAPPTSIEATAEDSVLHIGVFGVLFRDNNQVCGFAERSDDDLIVLLQPCVLMPEGGTSSGDCWYDAIAFDVDEVNVVGAHRVTVLQRVDRTSGMPPFTPKELASAALQ